MHGLKEEIVLLEVIEAYLLYCNYETIGVNIMRNRVE